MKLLPTLLCCLAVLTWLPVGRLSAQEIPVGVERPLDPLVLRKLIGRPQATSASVKPFLRDGRVWCATKAECEGVFHEPIDQLARVLRNREAYPQYFSRITTNIVERRDGRIIEHQVMSINVLGIIYRNAYVLDGTELMLENPRRLLNQWVQGGSDGTVEGIAGLWYLEEFLMDGELYTYIRYRMQSEIPQSVPGQASLMMLFLSHDLIETMLDVVRAAHKF